MNAEWDDLGAGEGSSNTAEDWNIGDDSTTKSSDNIWADEIATDSNSGGNSNTADDWNIEDDNSDDWNIGDGLGTKNSNNSWVDETTTDNSWVDSTPDNNWGNNDASSGANNSDNPNQFIDNSETESFNDFANQDFDGGVQETAPVQINIGKKKVALVIAGVLVLLAVIVSIFGRMKVTKTSQVVVTPSVEDSSNTDQTDVPVDNSDNSSSNNVASDGSSRTLVELPSDTSLNYATDVENANGVVTSKTILAQGSQLLYCVKIRGTFGSSTQDVDYYCTYATYNSVKVNDLLAVTYQVVEDKYISINSIEK